MRRHCSDQELLGLTHGTPGWLARFRGEFHVNFCGRCRRRVASMEAAANSWKSAALGPFVLPEEKVEAARQRFLARVSAEVAPVSTGWPMGVRVALVSGALACGVMAGIGVWTSRENAPVVKIVENPAVVRVPAEKREIPAPVVRVVAPPSIDVSGEVVPTVAMEDPRETEVNLLWALHEGLLCRTGSVEVVGATLRGVVETREQLVALKTLVEQEVRGTVRVEVRTADEAASVAVSVPVSVPVSGRVEIPAGQKMLRTWLTGRGLPEAEVTAETTRIANQAVRLANEAWVESWALQRLVERFGPEERRGMKLASRARLYEMLKSHFDALEKVLAQERELLLPIIGNDSTATASSGLFADVARLSSSLQDAFGGTGDAGLLRAMLTATSGAASRWGSGTLPEWNVFAAASDMGR